MATSAASSWLQGGGSTLLIRDVKSGIKAQTLLPPDLKGGGSTGLFLYSQMILTMLRMCWPPRAAVSDAPRTLSAAGVAWRPRLFLPAPFLPLSVLNAMHQCGVLCYT